MTSYALIYEIVGKIPEGTVTTYGRIARQVNCGARQVGYALAALPADQKIPWHRVINSNGMISRRKEGDRDSLQEQLLQAEGITFKRSGKIDLNQFGWHELEWEC